MLNTIEDRNARWYYLSALANAAVGKWNVAQDHIRTAYAKEPDNMTYHQAYSDITNGINPLKKDPFSSFFDFGDMGVRIPTLIPILIKTHAHILQGVVVVFQEF